MRQRHTPPDVPPGFWEYEGFAEPLHTRHFGRLIRAYRHHPGHFRVLPQQLVGEWLGLTQAQLSRIETGPRLNDLTRLMAWATTLGIPAERLWFDTSTGSRRVRYAPESTSQMTAPAQPGGMVGGQPPVSKTDADRLLGLFLQLEAEIGGNDLYEPMTRHVDRLARMAEQDPTPIVLYSLGQLSQMAGWLALDSNRHGAARHYLTTATYAANEVDDPLLAASALAYMSLQATYGEKPKQAHALAVTASQVAEKAPTPLVRTMLATRLARAQAKLGRREESLRSLAGAQAAYSEAGNTAEPLWISYVDDIEVNAQAGACYLDLGLHPQAEDALVHAIELLKATRPERVRDHVH